MPLNKGTVSAPGGVGVGVGLAKELYDALREEQGITEGPQNAVGLEELAKLSRVIARVVIDHFVANATITATPTLTVAPGIAVTTAGSATAQAGTTTAPGSATGTVVSTLT